MSISTHITRGEGWLVVGALVTDGRDTWYESRRFMDYTRKEALALYREAIASSGWRITEEADS